MTDKNTADKHAIDNNVAQGIAAYMDYVNQLRVSTLLDTDNARDFAQMG